MIPCFSTDHFTAEERQGCKVKRKSLEKLVGETCGQATLWDTSFILYSLSFNRPSQHLNFWINIQIKMLMHSQGRWGDATWWHLHPCLHTFLVAGVPGATWEDMRALFVIPPVPPTLPGLIQCNPVSRQQRHQALPRAPLSPGGAPWGASPSEDPVHVQTPMLFKSGTPKSEACHFSWEKTSLTALQTHTAGQNLLRWAG